MFQIMYQRKGLQYMFSKTEGSRKQWIRRVNEIKECPWESYELLIIFKYRMNTEPKVNVDRNGDLEK